MEETVRIPNQGYDEFMEKHLKAKEQAVKMMKEECKELVKYCIYYVAEDNRTWRANFGLETKLQNELNGLFEAMKEEYESYTRINGVALVLRGDGGVNAKDRYITSLTVASGSGNGVSRLELLGYERLKDICIGDNCFTKVIRFKVDGLSSLEKLVVGKKSFTNGEYRSTTYVNRSFVVRNCPMLTLIDIGECSFAEWGGEWELSGLDRLERLRIASADEESRNFQASPFVIKSGYITEL